MLTVSVERPGAEWDLFCAASPQGTIFSMSFWLAASAGDRARVLICRRGGEIAGGLVFVEEQGRWPERRRAGHPPLTPYLGLVLAPPRGATNPARNGAAKAVVSTLLEALAAPRYDQIRLALAPSYVDGQPLLWSGYRVEPAYTYQLALTPGAEVLWRRFDGRVRNDVRRAERRGYRAAVEQDAAVLLRLFHETFARQRMAVPIGADLIRALLDATGARAQGEVLVGRDTQGAARAAAFVVRDHRAAYYLIGASDGQGRADGAMSLVLWEAVRRAAGRVPLFDFEGSDVPAIEFFFRGFGGELVPRLVATRWGSALAEIEADLRKYARRMRAGLRRHLEVLR